MMTFHYLPLPLLWFLGATMTSLSKLTYTVPEVLELLHICRTTLYNLIEDGKIKKVPNLGRKILITRDEIMRFLEITEDKAA
jgi:excisionase family DNA binding protein